ncbi:hypothetical protein GCM10009551_097870 [Nocardiopsis tropica]|uniref:hypothetical protein n=1 Tax=Tsukamurella strandjordii TaxID=147577 RepID=UPI0031D96CC3
MRADQIPVAMKALTSELKSRHLHAETDRRNMNLPAALVELERIDFPTLCGEADVFVAVELLAGDQGGPQSLNQLATMVGKLDGLPDMSTLTATLAPNGTTLGLRFIIPLERYAP